MKFLLLNQTFYPDVMATGQYLTEVALRLIERGHEVTVITSRRAYDDPDKQFPKSDDWRGIRIIRIGSTGFGKGGKWRRAADFASFLAVCALRLALLPRQDAVVALTSPPLISFLGACMARVRRSRFFYWVMDFNPDEALAAGWLRPGSMVARVLESMSRFSLGQATRIIALDRFMRDRILAKGISPEKIVVLPPWSQANEIRFDPESRERFRKANGLDGKFVVMYSGNHSPCHPLDTLLAAARQLADNPDIVFCFVGGGSEWRRIKNDIEASLRVQSSKSKVQSSFAGPSTLNSQSSTNLLCLPYQPLSELSGSLSAADLHIVVMGDRFVGIVHPCKIYNILQVGSPVLYIGPRPSHLSEILTALNGEYSCAGAAHGDVDQVVQQIRNARKETAVPNRQTPERVLSNFSKESVLPRLIGVLEAV